MEIVDTAISHYAKMAALDQVHYSELNELNMDDNLTYYFKKHGFIFDWKRRLEDIDPKDIKNLKFGDAFIRLGKDDALWVWFL